MSVLRKTSELCVFEHGKIPKSLMIKTKIIRDLCMCQLFYCL